MELCFNTRLIDKYKSESQKIRVMSESWVANNIYCPYCGNNKITQFENNRPVADFYCEKCGETFELKSKCGKIGRKINDGAYDTAIKRIVSNTNPSLFILQYNNYTVVSFEIIPKYFFTPDVIEARKPLAQTAKRAGWKGCNILFGDIPIQGRIKIIENSQILNKDKIVKDFNKTRLLSVTDISKRGWLIDILKCVNLIKKDIFNLTDVYKYEYVLKRKHPNNNNIQAKIRQQLQLLRNKGYIQFLGNGQYKKNL